MSLHRANIEDLGTVTSLGATVLGFATHWLPLFQVVSFTVAIAVGVATLAHKGWRLWLYIRSRQ